MFPLRMRSLIKPARRAGDTVCSNREIICIAEDTYSAEVVRSRFLKLIASHIVFDFSEITQKYHSILKFEFEDIYQKKYYQLLYLYFDKKDCAVLPISKLYCSTRRKR